MTGVGKECGESAAPAPGVGAAWRLPRGAPQVDGRERRLVADLLACVPHPVACSPRHFTGRTGGGTEPRRPLTGMARSPGTSALTLALGFASQCPLVAGCPLSPWGQWGLDAERHHPQGRLGSTDCRGHFPVQMGNLASRGGPGGQGRLQVFPSHSACTGLRVLLGSCPPAPAASPWSPR